MLGKDSEGSPPLLSRDAQQALAHGMEEGRGGPRIGGKEKGGGGATDREEEEEEARRGGLSESTFSSSPPLSPVV